MKDMTDSREPYADRSQLESLVRGFESCTLAEFKHASHLSVALWYLARLPEAEAFVRMREGLHRFAAHHHSNLYHETITIFWLRFVRHFITRSDHNTPTHVLANQLADSRPDVRLIFDYYSQERLSSDEAKTSWIEPDLKPLDF
ncbi:MAG: hypothetical protein QOE33_2066 [Acidobacteriota bacterium]|nr:hypothetical protein [Acidobacteriota bacterium]